MNKHLLNLPVVIAAVFSLGATAVIAVISFTEPPTMLLESTDSPPQAVPDFVVFDQDGVRVTREDMLGEVWVCDFFLTRCTGTCPLLGQVMTQLAIELDGDRALRGVQLISFSVDPEVDTPEALLAYRATNFPTWTRGNEDLWDSISPRWRHTTSDGDRGAFWAIVEKGFFLAVDETPDDSDNPVTHSSKLVLIDAQGRIRGYYEGLNPEEVDILLHDLRRIVNED